jgi:hypothetical protein
MQSLGKTTKEILDGFRRLDRENVGRRIAEADIIGGSLRFRWQGNGKLGVVVGDIGIRDATAAEYDELEEAVELGQVQIYTTPLFVSGRTMTRTIVHQATGTPMNQHSEAARRQRERWARITVQRQPGDAR